MLGGMRGQVNETRGVGDRLKKLLAKKCAVNDPVLSSQPGGLRCIPGIRDAYNGASGGVLQMAGVLPGRYLFQNQFFLERFDAMFLVVATEWPFQILWVYGTS
jgi:hypothetical protein